MGRGTLGRRTAGARARVRTRVAGLHFYPVKSCAGIARRRLDLTELGPKLDRHWMIVDEGGKFLTQRELPEMALVRTLIDSRSLTISTPAGRCRVSLADRGTPTQAQVWRYRGPVEDEGDEAAGLLSRFLGRAVRLVRLAPGHDRRSSSGAKLAFVDSAPLLVISQRSLDSLNEKLPAALPMDRFRPNIVLKGGQPHQEDRWERMSIGKVELKRVKPCSRCSITTVDQTTGIRLRPEPLKTLASYRLRGQKVLFGSYFQIECPGTIRVGDPVEVLA